MTKFGADHITKAVFLISASIFSKHVGGIKFKFGEEIEENLVDQQASPLR